MAVFVFPDKTTILIKRKDDLYHYPGSNCNQAAKSMTVTNIINNLTQDFKNMNFENIDKLELFTYLNTNIMIIPSQPIEKYLKEIKIKVTVVNPKTSTLHNICQKCKNKVNFIWDCIKYTETIQMNSIPKCGYTSIVYS